MLSLLDLCRAGKLVSAGSDDIGQSVAEGRSVRLQLACRLKFSLRVGTSVHSWCRLSFSLTGRPTTEEPDPGNFVDEVDQLV